MELNNLISMGSFQRWTHKLRDKKLQVSVLKYKNLWSKSMDVLYYNCNDWSQSKYPDGAN